MQLGGDQGDEEEDASDSLDVEETKQV